MKKVLALLLVLAISFTLLAGCGGKEGAAENSDPGTSTPGTSTSGGNDVSSGGHAGGTIGAGDTDAVGGSGPQELVIGLAADIGSFYPGGPGQSGVKAKRALCYETLFFMDAEGELYPLLAKSYEDLGNSTYSVELFDYIYDSEGNHMTASDIIFSIDGYIKDGQNAGTWGTITDYHTTGEYTFEITFDPEVVFQLKSFLSRVPMITQAAWESSPDEMASYPIGTGGYTLNKEASVVGSVYVFEKRDDYWQTDEQYICAGNMNNLDKVTAKVITDTSTLAVALQTGEIDFTTDISANDWNLFVDEAGNAKEGYVMFAGQNNSFAHLTFNSGPNSRCKDLKLRQAICYAIDAAACAYSVYGALGNVCNAATNPNLSDSGLEFGDDDYFTYDPEYAKQLVEESSYNGETIRILVLPAVSVSPCAALIQAYCAQVGITVELLEYDMAQYRSTRFEQSGTVYDIELLGATSGDYCVCVSVWELDGRQYENGLGRHFVNDTVLQELYEKCYDANTTSPELIQDLLDHIEDNVYMYGLYYCGKMLFGNDKIVSGMVGTFNDAVYPSFVVNN